jgi:hypothetical protein
MIAQAWTSAAVTALAFATPGTTLARALDVLVPSPSAAASAL